MFELKKLDANTRARRGVVKTRTQEIQTPVFMPVGTLGSVKSLDPRDLDELGAEIVLANAYHLMLRPGDEQVRDLGGLHEMCGYKNQAILTDSGGFQVYSLSKLRKVTDEGVKFRSHIDGSLHELSPERLVELQENLGPDIAMVLDECPPAQSSREDVIASMTRTTAWAKRAQAARQRDDIAWFGIVQGALFEDLREEHAETLKALNFDGYAIGGVSVGEAPPDIAKTVWSTAPHLPEDKPRYLMGVGTPGDLVRGVAAGVDMFDCVMPTRNARTGSLFTWSGKVNIKHSANRGSKLPIDESCSCYTCRTFTRGFLRHLFVSNEISYTRLATIHNLHFYLDLMRKIRLSLEEGTFDPRALLIALGESLDIDGSPLNS